MSNKKIGIIGVGNMGLAIISGAISSGVFTKDDIIAFEKNEVRQKHIESTIGICFASSLQDLARCELILMAVKPQDLEDVSKSLSEYILPETLVVSVAGGVTTETLQKYLSGKGHIIRVMPNTPVSVCSGVSALCIGDRCTEEDIKKTQKLFQSLGTTLVIKEDMFDAISALSGSGPAYFFYMIEALAASAIQRGFDEKTALNLVIETCYGAIKLLKSSGKSPQELRKEVTSPGGSTAEAIEVFDKEKMPGTINNAIEAAIHRSKEMDRQNTN